MSDGTIDLTDIAEKMKATFVIAGKEFLLAQALAIPGLGPFAAWAIRNLAASAIEWVLVKLSNWTYMQAFFINTAIRKASQARDYVAAVDAKDALPADATDEEFENAERLELESFDRLVRVSN